MNFRLATTTLLFFVFLAGVHLYFYAQNISLKYQVTEIKIRLNEQKNANRQLGGQVARAENLAYVEEYATNKLKMIYPEQVIYIVGTREVNPAPSSPADRPAARD
ncbi:MAG: septum formation initiator family protein [Candidatus Margulisbacteria bacterium]|jgi:cell division protein FtsB|nr:septum formation initiator family protein [Candidatus Margulisiibacteriota bacterium]